MQSTVFAILMFLGSVFSPQNDITQQVLNLMQSGNSQSLSAHFSAKIDLAVPGVDDVYSRAQAELILKKFFASNPPQSATLVHQGTSKLGVQYRIATLKTGKGDFRVSFHMKDVGGKLYIQQLRIEPSDDDF